MIDRRSNKNVISYLGNLTVFFVVGVIRKFLINTFSNYILNSSVLFQLNQRYACACYALPYLLFPVLGYCLPHWPG